MNARGIVLDGVRLQQRRRDLRVRERGTEERATPLVVIPLAAIVGIVLTLIALAIYSAELPPSTAQAAHDAEGEASPALHRALEPSLPR